MGFITVSNAKHELQKLSCKKRNDRFHFYEVEAKNVTCKLLWNKITFMSQYVKLITKRIPTISSGQLV